MARGSKKGACSARVEAAKPGCLKHNRREQDKPTPNINHNLSKDNHTVFEADEIKNLKTLTPLIKKAEQLYVDKVHQKCQKSFTPFREDVLSLPGRGDITDEQLMEYKAMVEKDTGWKVMGMWYHKDEGYKGSKFVEGNEDYKINYHVHCLYYCQDPETGKACRNDRKFFSLRQDWLAKATGMERGNKAADTHINGQKAAQFRINAQEARAEQILANAEQQAADLVSEAQKEAEALSPGIVLKGAASVVAGLAGMSGKDKTIKQLKETIAGEPGRIQDAVDNAKAEERQQVIDEVKTAAKGLRIAERNGKETAQDIGKSWRWHFDRVKTLEKAAETAKAAKSVEITNAVNNATAALKQEKSRAEKDAEEARRQAKLWKDRFSTIWPAAVAAIAAIVEKVNSTWQNLFTSAQVDAIDKALKSAGDVDQRIDYGKDLMEFARPEFTRKEGDTAKQVEDIARNGTNVQKIGEGIGY